VSSCCLKLHAQCSHTAPCATHYCCQCDCISAPSSACMFFKARNVARARCGL
jgi:hypothetical protein